MTMTNSELSQQQRQAAESDHPFTLVLAAPGSGKTRTIVARVAHLVASGVNPAGIAVITFTNNAAGELDDRLVAQGTSVGYVGTVHGLMLRMLREHHKVLKLARPPTVIDEEQSEAIMERILKDLRLGKEATVSKLSAHVRENTEIVGSPSKLDLAATAYHLELLRNCMLDFDGVLLCGAKLLKTYPTACAWVRHVLVDEAQDSGTADLACYAEMSKTAHFTFVGDPDQSIFSFRGGNVEVIESLYDGTPPFAPMFFQRLDGNYRCSLAVCERADFLIAHNDARIPKKMTSESGLVGEVMFLQAEDEAKELDGVARSVRSALENCALGDCAVLVRTNWLAERFTKGLSSYSIPVARRDLAVLPPDWRKALAALACLADPDNEFLAGRYLRFALGDGVSARIAEANRAMTQLRAFDGDPLPEAFTLPDHFRHVVKFLRDKCGVSAESLCRVERAAQTFRGFFDLAGLLLACQREGFESETITPGIYVGTIHSAKGKEFRHVWLPAFEEGVIPSRRAKTPADLEEERRLAYVAVTRAKDTVVVTHSRSRKPSQPEWAKPAPCAPSRFIEEMRAK